MICLLVLAVLYANQNDDEKAVEVLALAFTHPMSPTEWIEKWMLIERLKAQLESTLSTEQYASAWQLGTEMELETVLHNWLREQD
jgi:hypothetical protein